MAGAGVSRLRRRTASSTCAADAEARSDDLEAAFRHVGQVVADDGRHEQSHGLSLVPQLKQKARLEILRADAGRIAGLERGERLPRKLQGRAEATGDLVEGFGEVPALVEIGRQVQRNVEDRLGKAHEAKLLLEPIRERHTPRHAREGIHILGARDGPLPRALIPKPRLLLREALQFRSEIGRGQGQHAEREPHLRGQPQLLPQGELESQRLHHDFAILGL